MFNSLDVVIYFSIKMLARNDYTIGCPPVRGLSYIQVDKHGITILYHLHECLAHHEIISC